MPCSCVGLPQATGKKKGGPSRGGWSDELRAAFRGVVVLLVGRFRRLQRGRRGRPLPSVPA